MTKAAEPLIALATDFLRSLLGKPVEIAASIASERLEGILWLNRVRVLLKARELLGEEAAIAATPLPPSLYFLS